MSSSFLAGDANVTCHLTLLSPQAPATGPSLPQSTLSSNCEPKQALLSSSFSCQVFSFPQREKTLALLGSPLACCMSSIQAIWVSCRPTYLFLSVFPVVWEDHICPFIFSSIPLGHPSGYYPLPIWCLNS